MLRFVFLVFRVSSFCVSTMGKPSPKKQYSKAGAQKRDSMSDKGNLDALILAIDAAEEQSAKAAAAPEAAAAAAPEAAATDEATTTKHHRFLSDQDFAEVKDKKLADVRRGHPEKDHSKQYSETQMRQLLIDTRTEDYKKGIEEVEKLPSRSGRDPIRTFTEGLKTLSKIKDSAVLACAMGEYVSRKISATFSVQEAPIRKPGSGLLKGKIVPLSSGMGLPVKKNRKHTFPIGKHVGYTFANNPVVKIYLGKMLLFEVKESKLPGAGFGVFAVRTIKDGEVIGAYTGNDVTSRTVVPNEYAIQFGRDNRRLQADNDDHFGMGLHLINDHQHHLYGTDNPPDESDDGYNVRIMPNLLVKAIKNIEPGDELSLFYNLTDESPTSSEQVIRPSTKGDDDENEGKKRGRPSDENEDDGKKTKKPVLTSPSTVFRPVATVARPPSPPPPQYVSEHYNSPPQLPPHYPPQYYHHPPPQYNYPPPQYNYPPPQYNHHPPPHYPYPPPHYPHPPTSHPPPQYHGHPPSYNQPNYGGYGGTLPSSLNHQQQQQRTTQPVEGSPHLLPSNPIPPAAQAQPVLLPSSPVLPAAQAQPATQANPSPSTGMFVPVVMAEDDTDSIFEEMEAIDAKAKENERFEKMKLLHRELRSKYFKWLYDIENKMYRGYFLTTPPDLLEMLENAWHSTGLDQKGKGKFFKSVQDYTPNLLMAMMEHEGMVSNIRYFGHVNPEHAAKVTANFKQLLASALYGMNYAKDDSFADQINIHLSFMKTTEAKVQEPHIDFLFQSVTGNMSEGPKTPSGKQPIKKTRRANADLPLRERMPFIVFMPLAEEGMSVELWSFRGEKHKDYMNELGKVVHIPYGTFLLVRGDTVHAGGFKTGEMGNPRAHFYVYQGKDGTVHDPMPKNTYNLPSGESRLSDYYFHDKDIPGVRRSGLVGVKLWVGDKRVCVLSDNPRKVLVAANYKPGKKIASKEADQT